jgi:hypothetical protein
MSPVDMSSGLAGIECTFGAHTDSYLELLVKDAYAVGRILKYLIALP